MSALLGIRKSLWKLSDERGRLWVKLGLVLMGVAILSKSLIQFLDFLMGRAVFPPCCLT